MKKILIMILCAVLIGSAAAAAVFFAVRAIGSPPESNIADPGTDENGEQNGETTPEEETYTTPDLGFGEPEMSSLPNDDANAVNVDNIADEYKTVTRGVTYIKPTEEHFEINGFPYFEENRNSFYRLLYADRNEYPSGVQGHAVRSSGGRIRFRTDSDTLTINIILGTTYNRAVANNSLIGASGLDVFAGNGTAREWVGTIIPAAGTTASTTQTITLPEGMNDITVEMPYFAEVRTITFGFDSGALLASPTPYKYESPVVFYGSSITHGIAASKPGNAYPAILSRTLDFDYINLGFSGSAKGERVMSDFIASLEDISVFVYDYDYNAAGVSDLQSTHYTFYKAVRDAHPDIPIIIMTKCNVAISSTDTNAQRRAVIKATYDRAVSEGDKNVYYIDGQYVFPEIGRDLCWGDGTHPNDVGFYYMAKAVYPVLKEVLESIG